MAAMINMLTLRPRIKQFHFQRQSFNLNTLNTPSLPTLYSSPPKFKLNCTNNSSVTTTAAAAAAAAVVTEEVYEKRAEEEEHFDWYSEWYAVAPVCDLDKSVPHGKKILGIDVVIWWDRNQEQWRVFEDHCPHRLAPLSEGRIDAWGRLQCVYHGWCFSGSGSCKLIPQAPLDGNPVHTSKKACVASYPCTVQHDILWFWPNSDPQYQDIVTRKQPPYIPELDDPSYTRSMGIRDFPYGYEVLVENIMDPAHVHYAHYGLMPPMPVDKSRPNADREGGKPLDISVQKVDKTGFSGTQEGGYNRFMPPCVFYLAPNKSDTGCGSENESTSASEKVSKEELKRRLLIFICIPVSPGKCRALWIFPRNFMVWLDKIVPRWMFHIYHNLVLDSDLYLLHMEEQKIMEISGGNWQKAFYVPTKSDAIVIAFRKWLHKYARGGVDWRHKFDAKLLPPTPRRDVLMDRYWSHVVNCTSCTAAYKGLKLTETMLQIVSVALIGVVALIKHGSFTALQRTALFATAVFCFTASRWLSTFIYKQFHFHDYKHAHI
ncbi:hypothetical protein vseg_008577 [Gypsophila vaccaria]